jgi:hypothetical protein
MNELNINGIRFTQSSFLEKNAVKVIFTDNYDGEEYPYEICAYDELVNDPTILIKEIEYLKTAFKFIEELISEYDEKDEVDPWIDIINNIGAISFVDFYIYDMEGMQYRYNLPFDFL